MAAENAGTFFSTAGTASRSERSGVKTERRHAHGLSIPSIVVAIVAAVLWWAASPSQSPTSADRAKLRKIKGAMRWVSSSTDVRPRALTLSLALCASLVLQGLLERVYKLRRAVRRGPAPVLCRPGVVVTGPDRDRFARHAPDDGARRRVGIEDPGERSDPSTPPVRHPSPSHSRSFSGTSRPTRSFGHARSRGLEATATCSRRPSGSSEAPCPATTRRCRPPTPGCGRQRRRCSNWRWTSGRD